MEDVIMIDTDVSLFKELIQGYSSALKKIEEYNNDIISNFNELSKYWHDSKSLKLNSSVKLEIQRMVNLESNIKNQLEIYKYLENEYKKIGNKIKCNLEAKDMIDNKLVSIISAINNILNQYNELGDISFYPRSYVIENQKNDIKNILDSFNNIKEKVNNTFISIQNIESTVSERLEGIEVQMFLLNNYESGE